MLHTQALATRADIWAPGHACLRSSAHSSPHGYQRHQSWLGRGIAVPETRAYTPSSLLRHSTVRACSFTGQDRDGAVQDSQAAEAMHYPAFAAFSAIGNSEQQTMWSPSQHAGRPHAVGIARPYEAQTNAISADSKGNRPGGLPAASAGLDPKRLSGTGSGSSNGIFGSNDALGSTTSSRKSRIIDRGNSSAATSSVHADGRSTGAIKGQRRQHRNLRQQQDFNHSEQPPTPRTVPDVQLQEALTSVRHALQTDVGLSAASKRPTTQTNLFLPAEQSQIRQSWRKIMRWSKVNRDDSAVVEATTKVVVFGGGSFGTAVGAALARQKGDLNVTLLLRDPYVCQEINTLHCNRRYLEVRKPDCGIGTSECPGDDVPRSLHDIPWPTKCY